MCANYLPVTRASRLLEFFGVRSVTDSQEADVFPHGLAPMVRRAPPDTPPDQTQRYLETGIFRFVPASVSKLEWARNTYNARSEAVATKRTYSEAWANGQRCIIPAEAIYEQKHDSGKSVRRLTFTSARKNLYGFDRCKINSGLLPLNRGGRL